MLGNCFKCAWTTNSGYQKMQLHCYDSLLAINLARCEKTSTSTLGQYKIYISSYKHMYENEK